MTAFVPTLVRKNLDFVVLLIVLTTIFAISYRNVAPESKAFGNIFPFPVDPADSFMTAFFGHYWTMLGQPSNFSFIAFIQGVLTLFLLGNVGFAQNLYFLSGPPISGILMYFFMRHMRMSVFVRMFIPVLYATSGHMIASYLAGNPEYLAILAFFPALMLTLYRFLDSPTVRNTFIFSIATAVFLLAYNLQGITFALPYLLIFSLSRLSFRGRQHVFKVIKKSPIWFAAVIVLILPALLGLVLPTTFNFGQRSIIADEHQLYNELVLNYQERYVIESIMKVLVVVVLPLSILSWLIVKQFRIDYLGYLLVIAAVMMLGLLNILGESQSIIDALPILYSLRDPDKIFLMTNFAVATAFGIFLHSVQLRFSKIRNRVISKAVLACSSSAMILISLFAVVFFPYDHLLANPVSNLQEFIGGRSFKEYAVPETYFNIRNYFQTHHSQEGYFRTLWLPQDRVLYHSIMYSMQVPYFFEDVQVLKDARWPAYSTTVLKPFEWNPWFRDEGKLLGEFGVKYIVVHGGIRPEECKQRGCEGPAQDYGYGAEYDRVGDVQPFIPSPNFFLVHGSYDGFKQYLDNQVDLKLVSDQYTTAGFIVYENEAVEPIFSVKDKIIVVASQQYSDRSNYFSPKATERTWAHNSSSVVPVYSREILELAPFYDESTYVSLADFETDDNLQTTLSISDGVVVFGDVLQERSDDDMILNAKVLVEMLRAESALVSHSQTQESRIDIVSSLLPTYTVDIDSNSNATLKFYAPRDSDYVLQLRASEIPSAVLDDDTNVLFSQNKGVYSSLYEWSSTNKMFLTKGDHYIQFSSNSFTSLDQLAVISINDDETYDKLMDDSANATLEVLSHKPSSALLNVNSSRPFVVVYRMSYNDLWDAHVGNAQPIHLKTGLYGWANGFYVKPDSKCNPCTIALDYSLDALKLGVNAVWISSWVITGLYVVLLAFPPISSTLFVIIRKLKIIVSASWFHRI